MPGCELWHRTPVGGIDRATSAVVDGGLLAGDGVLLAQGAVLRGDPAVDTAIRIGGGSAVLENCVVVGTPAAPVDIGRKVVFGHRCLVIGARIGDLSEIGNGTILMPGARLGRRVFTGEGTLVPAGADVPDESVVVGRPARRIRSASAADLARLAGLRGGDLTLPPEDARHPLRDLARRGHDMGKLYAYGDKRPQIAASAQLFDSAEITGDVEIGAGTIIGSGVKIIGDSHGPVRIGARVQILENSVLHLLPDNTLVLEDDVVIGPGAMIHGCHIGAGSVVEPGAIVCDHAVLGRGCQVLAGSVVKQRAQFGDLAVLEGFPARQVATASAPPARPGWALPADVSTRMESIR
jgi:carbonic anhydrase/acetyltransferase-like protein (isoleucine patch superfamily)